MSDDGYTVIDAMRDLAMTDRVFFQSIRLLGGETRNSIVAAYLRNSREAMTIIRMYMNQDEVVMNIPITLSGNGTFMDPVLVVPTAEQIEAATETFETVVDEDCAICQESVEDGTRIRHCGHCFHTQCIAQWLSVNTRCPVCRHDVRDLQSNSRVSNNDSRMHSDDE